LGRPHELKIADLLGSRLHRKEMRRHKKGKDQPQVPYPLLAPNHTPGQSENRPHPPVKQHRPTINSRGHRTENTNSHAAWGSATRMRKPAHPLKQSTPIKGTRRPSENNQRNGHHIHPRRGQRRVESGLPEKSRGDAEELEVVRRSDARMREDFSEVRGKHDAVYVGARKAVLMTRPQEITSAGPWAEAKSSLTVTTHSHRRQRRKPAMSKAGVREQRRARTTGGRRNQETRQNR